MNLTEMTALVRRELKDENSADYRWTAEELEGHINHAVNELSLNCPLESCVALDTVNGSRDIDVSSLTARTGIRAVEFPTGLTPPRYQRFSLWGDTLTLLGEDVPDGSDCMVYFTQVHTLDEAGSTVPAHFEALVACGACGYAAVAWAGYAVNRVNTGGTDVSRDWLQWGNEKLASFREDLRRHGSRNAVRISQFYIPHYIPVARSTDPGP